MYKPEDKHLIVAFRHGYDDAMRGAKRTYPKLRYTSEEYDAYRAGYKHGRRRYLRNLKGRT